MYKYEDNFVRLSLSNWLDLDFGGASCVSFFGLFATISKLRVDFDSTFFLPLTILHVV